MRKLISVLAITATMASCGKSITKGTKGEAGLSVSGSKGISKTYQKSENLILVIKNKSINMVKTALIGEADPNYLSFSGERPLIVAANAGSTEIVEELLRYGASPELTDSKGNLAIFQAIEHNKLGSLKAIFKKSKNINILNNDKESVLIAALKRSNQTMSNFLIKNGVNIYLKDKDGKRPIEIARAKGLYKSLNLLLDVTKIEKKGLRANFILDTIKDSAKETLDYITNRFVVKDYLNGSNALCATLNLEDKADRSLMLNTLLKNNLSANGESDDTLVPIIQAVKVNDLYSVNLLIAKGADPNKLDKNSLTALVHASMKLNYTLVDELVQKGAVTEYEYIYNGKTMVRDTCKFVPRNKWGTLSTIKKKIKLIKLRLGC